MKHYRLDKGVSCEVRKIGSSEWKPHTITKRLYFVECVESGTDRVFVHERWEIRVRADLLAGAATAPAPAAPEALSPPSQIPEGHLVLTSDNLHATANSGCFTKGQLDLLGVPRRPAKGWLAKLVGTTMPLETYERLMALKGDGKSRSKNKDTVRPFKSHNTLGKPLCPCCGSNPRGGGAAKCARCERENRPIQWGRIADVTRTDLQQLGLTEPPSD